MILIGPEGDFSPEEVEQAIACGFQPVMLGQSRLRTETAGVVACHTIQVLNQLKSKDVYKRQMLIFAGRQNISMPLESFYFRRLI